MGSEISMSFQRLDESRETLKSSIDQELDNVRQHLHWVEGQVAPFNSNLPAQIARLLQARREKLLEDQGIAHFLDIPIRRRTGAPQTYRVPEIRRKPSIALSPVLRGAESPDPTLGLDIYGEILNIIHNMTMVMERSPSVFSRAREEDIRVHFLVQLNGQYEGMATGETFNLAGKTDILLRYKSQNLFIAECKFWKGKKAFLDTIDQLFGYVSWRDTKTAILVFNRTKNTTAVIACATEAAESHPQFKSVHKKLDESRTCYVFAHPQDGAREFYLTVAIYDIPAPATPNPAQPTNPA